MLVRATTLLVVPALLAAACGSGPAAPTPSAGDPVQASLRIVADPVVDLTPGETRALQIEERDASGALVTQPLTAYSWTTSAPDTVSVGPDGVLRAHADLGGAAITVRSPGGRSATVHAWVQLPAHVPSTYRITLIFDPGIPSGWRDVFRTAAAMIEDVVRAPLAPFPLDGLSDFGCTAYPGEPAIPALTGTETGTIVYVGRRSGAGPTTGGPCIQRALPRPTTVFGQITIPRGDSDPGSPPVRLALHEIGHVLGLVGISYRRPSPGFDSATSRHTGPFTLEGYRRTFGQTVPFVPVMPSAAHWDFGGDVMSNSAPVTIMTKATIGALMDMGYPAVW